MLALIKGLKIFLNEPALIATMPKADDTSNDELVAKEENERLVYTSMYYITSQTISGCDLFLAEMTQRNIDFQNFKKM